MNLVHAIAVARRDRGGRPARSRRSISPAFRGRDRAAPIVQLPPRALLAELAQEYVFAELCEALTLSLAAENEARMRAMSAAKTNVSKMLDELVARSRQLRQEEITNEIIELGGRRARGGAAAGAVTSDTRLSPN